MPKRPAITLSIQDRERLYRLLDNHRGDEEVVDHLYEELERANFLETEKMPANVVSLDSKVTFFNEDNNKTYEMTLVMPPKASSASTISILSPAGAALLGLKTGDRIEWPSNGKLLHLRLLDVARS